MKNDKSDFKRGVGGTLLRPLPFSIFSVSRRICTGVALIYSSQPKNFTEISHIIARHGSGEFIV